MTEGTLKLDVLSEDAKDLASLLAPFPELRYEAKGWWPVKDVTISGPSSSLEQVRPILQSWQADCRSRDAW